MLLTAVLSVVGVVAVSGVTEALASTNVRASPKEELFEEPRIVSLLFDASSPAQRTRSGIELSEIESRELIRGWNRALSKAWAIVSTMTGPFKLSSA